MKRSLLPTRQLRSDSSRLIFLLPASSASLSLSGRFSHSKSCKPGAAKTADIIDVPLLLLRSGSIMCCVVSACRTSTPPQTETDRPAARRGGEPEASSRPAISCVFLRVYDGEHKERSECHHAKRWATCSVTAPASTRSSSTFAARNTTVLLPVSVCLCRCSKVPESV